MNTSASAMQRCDKHGPYRHDCRRCIDEREWRRGAAEIRAQRLRDEAERIGIPIQYTGACLADLEAKVKAAIAQWLTAVASGRSSGPLILVGPPGVGKSHAICAAAEAWLERQLFGARYITAAKYAERIRATWSPQLEESERMVVDTFAGAPLLCLDDLGAGKTNDAELLQVLICDRYNRGALRNTLVATNYAPSNWNTAFGDRSADRLRQGATCLTMKGESRRKAAKNIHVGYSP